MADILHDFPIRAAPARVFSAVSDPKELDCWWTKRCTGSAIPGREYELWFGPEYDWRAKVSRCTPDSEFELLMTRADHDWTGSKVGFNLQGDNATTRVRFWHTGWPVANDHFRISTFCWAMYLRLLRLYVETGQIIPYETRLDA